MMNNIDTKITRFLKQQNISFEILTHKTKASTIAEAASQRGVRPAQMVKCIVLRDMSNRYALACVPGDRSADPKKVRHLLQWRRMTCVSSEEVPHVTGYEIGTITPLLLETDMPIFFDKHIMEENEITISSGTLLAGIKMQLCDLIKLAKPEIEDITRSE